MAQNSKLLIVYNAEGGILNSVIHGVHKVLRPSTYPCSLCALTYGLVSMRSDWRRFLESLPAEIVFHHSDDFAEAFPDVEIDLPAILVSDSESDPETMLSASELDNTPTLEQLKTVTRERLAAV